LFLDGMKYLNIFWSSARAWAFYVKFGADLLAVQYLSCSTTTGKTISQKYEICHLHILDIWFLMVWSTWMNFGLAPERGPSMSYLVLTNVTVQYQSYMSPCCTLSLVVTRSLWSPCYFCWLFSIMLECQRSLIWSKTARKYIIGVVCCYQLACH
jgi:hypothetical protein